MNSDFNGLNMGLGTIARLSPAKSRSISAENMDGTYPDREGAPPKEPARTPPGNLAMAGRFLPAFMFPPSP